MVYKLLKSMTGFGRGEFIDEEHRIIVEIKTVNHRYNEIMIRMPKVLNQFEDKIRKEIGTKLQRGRIDVFITIEEFISKSKTIRVDKDLAIAYHKAIEELGSLFGVNVSENIYHLSKCPDVLKTEELDKNIEEIWFKVSTALQTCLGNIYEMRLREGQSITLDLQGRINKILDLVCQVEARGPMISEEYRIRMLNRMKETLEALSVEPDEARILQEVAIFAERANVTEEIVRLKSHLVQFNNTLLLNESVGRKLDFIIQEINRETNTIGSKANDLTLSNIVVEIKSEIEKVREQVQNVE